MKGIAPHEPKAELLSAEDVNKDVASLSSALTEERRAIESYKARLRASIKRTRRAGGDVDRGVDNVSSKWKGGNKWKNGLTTAFRR